ncbi:unnamed protein product [Leptosia nina]|uniref:Ig-like domain-containing protein n=1 Tax=Leptosia nina TaxID=320188 RepID=A0AAV1JJG0_9NEOP
MVPYYHIWLLFPVLFVAFHTGSCQATDVDVKLVAPSWVARGSSATLRCLHQVPPQLLYKVEFLRSGAKILQYVRERVPPYTNYTFQGGKVNIVIAIRNRHLSLDGVLPIDSRVWVSILNTSMDIEREPFPEYVIIIAIRIYMSLVTENSITLENLDPTASGLYWCEVSLETPIFTAASPPHQLTVVYSQKHPPIITFGKPDVVVGGLLRANCTSAPAAPAPKLMWYIDNEKVPEDSIKYFSYRVSSSTRTKGGNHRHRKYQHRYIAPEFNYTAKYWALVSETTPAPANLTKHSKCTLKDGQEGVAKIEKPRELAPPPISLWVSIAELRTPAHGRLQLTCTATIPEEVGPGERFADVKKQTVTVAVNELTLKKPRTETNVANGTAAAPRLGPLWLLGCGLLFRELTTPLM